MIEHGTLVEEITQVLGPIKRKRVYEQWHNSNLQVTATVPLSSRLVIKGVPGKVVSRLYSMRGNVEVIDKDRRTAW